MGLWSFQRVEMEGQRRLSREVRPSLGYSPDLRRLDERSPGSSPSLKQSSPGVHSGGEVGITVDCEALEICR